MITEYNTFNICQVYAVAFEYGDYSGLNDDEIQQIDVFIESMPEGHKTYQYSDSVDFTRDEISGLMADCIELTVFMDDSAFSCRD